MRKISIGALLAFIALAGAALAQQLSNSPGPGNAIIGCTYVDPGTAVDIGNHPLVRCDAYGRIFVSIYQSPTYAGVVTNLSRSADGDVYCVQGSASRDIRIRAIKISGVGNTSGTDTVQVIMRSAANIPAGTPVAITAYDQNSAAPTAQAFSYAAPPATTGAAIGVLRGDKLLIGNSNGSAQFAPIRLEFQNQPLILHGTSQFACVNITGIGFSTSYIVEHEHTEQ